MFFKIFTLCLPFFLFVTCQPYLMDRYAYEQGLDFDFDFIQNDLSDLEFVLIRTTIKESDKYVESTSTDLEGARRYVLGKREAGNNSKKS